MNQPIEPHVEPLLLRTLTRLRDATALPLTFGGPVDSGQRVRLNQFAGPICGALRGVALDFGQGLGGKVVALRRPMVVNDYVSSRGISHRYDHIITAEGLRAMVAVPVVVRRTVRGVLYGAVRSAVPLGDRVVQSIVDAARDLEQNLAVREELTRRMDWLDHRAASEDTAGPQWELVREAYAELRILAKTTDDIHIRERVESVCEKLSTPAIADSRPQAAPMLSPRELDVLACVALGWTNARVASDLDLSVETVKSYLRSAMSKLLARSRLEAVVAARRLGLLP